jgi:fucose 4-O-acetylase-like acetyltransferase
MKPRDQKIDIAKGIGILLIVFGHNWITLNENRKLFNVIFSFHVPLFFLLSGIFVGDGGRLRDFFLAKTDSILKPYIVSAFIFWILLNIGSNERLALPYFSGVLYGNAHTTPYHAFWFLPNLFAGIIILKAILIFTEKYKAKKEIRASIAACLFMVGIAGIKLFWNNFFANAVLPFHSSLPVGLPFSLDIVPITVAILMVGFLLKRPILDYAFRGAHFIMALILFIALHFIFNYTIDLNVRRYDSPIFSTMELILGVFLVISMSSFLSRYRRIADSLAYIGSASLIILLFHTLAQNQALYQSTRFLRNYYVCGIISFIAGVGLPLGLYFLIKSSRFLNLLFFSSGSLRKNCDEKRVAV